MLNLFVDQIPAGDAAKLSLQADDDITLVRWVRSLANDFVDENDVGLIREGYELFHYDASAKNGTVYFYKAYVLDSLSQWIASPVVTITPASGYGGENVDVLTLLMDRLEHGLAVEVGRSTLRHKFGKISVQNAPPLFEDTNFPLVTVHLSRDGPSEYAIGNDMTEFDVGDDGIEEATGWVASVSVDLIGWSMNPDERIALRKAIKRIVMANLSLFEGLGMTNVEFVQVDAEDLNQYPVPMYQSVGNFSCLVSQYVTNMATKITSAELIKACENG